MSCAAQEEANHFQKVEALCVEGQIWLKAQLCVTLWILVPLLPSSSLVRVALRDAKPLLLPFPAATVWDNPPQHSVVCGLDLDLRIDLDGLF